MIALGHGKRNTPSLFGTGRIDAIPDRVLLAAAQRKHPGQPDVTGRVSRLRDGSLGRFGWKAQSSRLREFVMQACANELGLEVPGRHQADDRPEVDFKALKFDLNADECQQLFEYVAALSPPIETTYNRHHPGGVFFERIGCATCHPRRLGNVEGIYSDLLLHDMGDRSADAGGGYAGSRRPVSLASEGSAGENLAGEAGPNEWRTPPLWGIKDSAPYLHDGSADSLDRAIQLHGGEATRSVNRYQRLKQVDRQAILVFLKTLGAPLAARR